jgi:hypothetical protein
MNLTRISTFIEINKMLKKEKEGFSPKWSSSAQLCEQASSRGLPRRSLAILQKGPYA